MSESWYERFKQWICEHFGHSPEKDKWKHDGHLIGCCKRCRVVYRIKKLDTSESDGGTKDNENGNIKEKIEIDRSI